MGIPETMVFSIMIADMGITRGIKRERGIVSNITLGVDNFDLPPSSIQKR